MKISVKAHPKSKQIKILEKGPGSYEIWVREAPDKGEANAAIVEVLSKHFGVSKSRIQILRGFGTKNKLVEVK